MQADSYWIVPLLDPPHQRFTDRKEHDRYLKRDFKIRDPDFTSIDQMNNPNMDFNNAVKDNWQEANEAQSYNIADASGRYFEQSNYNIQIICKRLNNKLFLMLI